MHSDYRGKLTSLCRETAKSFDMSQNGSRWKCEVTEVEISLQGVKRYSFYIYDKNSGHEYQAKAVLENNEDATWSIERVVQ